MLSEFASTRIADRGVVGVDESYGFMIIRRAKANGQRAASLGTQHAHGEVERCVRGVRAVSARVAWPWELGSGNDASVVHVLRYLLLTLRIGLEGPNRHMRRRSYR